MIEASYAHRTNRHRWHVRGRLSGLSWIDGKVFAVDAKVLPGTTKEQFQKMLQKMLAERFGLIVCHEIITLQVFDLVIGKNGSKLQPGGSAPPAEIVSEGFDKNCFPVLSRPGLVSRFGPGSTVHLAARDQTLDALGRARSERLRRCSATTGAQTGRLKSNLRYGCDRSCRAIACGKLIACSWATAPSPSRLCKTRSGRRFILIE